MSELKSIGLIICILMILMAYLKQAIPKGKTAYLMKTIVSVFILMSIVDGVHHFDFSSVKALTDSSYAQNDEVWTKASSLIGEGLQKEFQGFLDREQIKATVISVTVEGDQDSFLIKSVVMSGEQAETARNLIAGRYNIGIAYIEVKNE